MFYGSKHGELLAKDAEALSDFPVKNAKNSFNLLDFRGGSEEAYIFLYKRFYKPIMRYIRERIHNSEIAEEITQEVFIKVHRFRDSFHEDHIFSTWLWTIAKNTVFDYLRVIKNGRHYEYKDDHTELTLEKIVDPDQLPDSNICAETRMIRRDQRRRLIKLFKALTRQQKRVLWMRVVHHLSYQDISKQLQLSLASVKNLAYRGKIALTENVNSSPVFAFQEF